MPALDRLALFFLCGISIGALACESPEPFEISGNPLTEPNRLTTQVDMLRYFSEIGDYVNCIQEEYEAESFGDSDASELERLAQLTNDAVAEVEATRDLYVS
jgi:hypothetical protein